jgi:uncharacterized metal-binding protein YceD (DUF177 family)
MTNPSEAHHRLDWTESASAIAETGLERTRQATAAQCTDLAEEWGILDCKTLQASYVITPIGKGRFHMRGTATAVIVQECVVTLEPFECALDETIDVEFWPSAQLATEVRATDPHSARAAGEIDIDALSGEDPEPIRRGRLDVGNVVYQLLTAGLDPFPRGPDAELDRHESGERGDVGKQNPFAVLEALRRGSEDPGNS